MGINQEKIQSKSKKNILTYYRYDTIIESTRDIIKMLLSKKGEIRYEKDLNCSRYAKRFY